MQKKDTHNDPKTILMAKKIPPLSDAKVKSVKASDKAQTLFDGGGLFLLVPPAKYNPDGIQLPASKLWRFKYSFQGRDRRMSFGSYPVVSIAKARQKLQEAKELLSDGIDPQENKRRVAAIAQHEKEIIENTLEKVARQWYRVASTEWTDGHARTVLSRLERDILPPLGDKLISDITARDVLAALRIVESRQAFESAHRIKTIIGQIYTFALVSDIPEVTSNPAAGLSKVLKKPQKKNMAAILDPVEFGRMLTDIDTYAGTFVVKCALRLAPMLFVRPGELRNAKWSDVDMGKAVWTIPASETKQGIALAVPLSKQAIAILKDLHPFTIRSPYVFPGRAASRVMSGNSVNQALRTLGWDSETVCGHGFRATARTMLHEILQFSPDAIEAQLGHRVPDRLGSAYNRSKHLEERVRMMQVWADYLDKIKVMA